MSPSLRSQGTSGWDALLAGSQRRSLQLGCRGESFGCALALVVSEIIGPGINHRQLLVYLPSAGCPPWAARFAVRLIGANPMEGLLLAEVKHHGVPRED